MAKFPTIEEMAENVAEKALDEIEYNGKTIRQWIEIISASEHSTNLASLGTDCISRKQAIDALRTCYDTETITMDNGDEYINYGDAVGEIEQLPPIQPKRGRWIGKYPVSSICSECGYLINDSKVKVFAFCPNCGAKMEATT